MRRFYYILMAFLMYMLLCSKSCVNERKEITVSPEVLLFQARSEIKKEFESDYLTDRSLRAFEVKAKEKLVDLTDYLKIYSEAGMDESFKKQSIQMILDLFVTDDILINSQLGNESVVRMVSVRSFLKITSGTGSSKIILDSFKITDPLHLTADSRYSGSVRFSRKIAQISVKDTLLSPPVDMQADIFVRKIKKSFGKDSLQVWKVSLGKIDNLKHSNTER